MFAGMGLWVAAAGSAARNHPKFSKGFLVVCAVKTCGFWLAHVGIVFANVPLVIAGAVGGGLIGGPLYHAWLGVVMFRTSHTDNRSTDGRRSNE
jgi:transposase